MTQPEPTTEEREQELTARLKARFGEEAPKTRPHTAGPAAYRDYPPDIGDVLIRPLTGPDAMPSCPILPPLFSPDYCTDLAHNTEIGLGEQLSGAGCH